VIVRSSKLGHASRNFAPVDGSEGSTSWVKTTDAGVLQTIDAFANYLPGQGNGKVWRPWRSTNFNDFFQPVGIDQNGNYISNWPFVKFKGRLGTHVTNTLSSAAHFDNSGLSGCRWAYMKSVGSVIDEALRAARYFGSDWKKKCLR